MKNTCKFCKKEYDWYEDMPNWKKGNISGNGYGSISSKLFCSYECGIKDKLEKRKKTSIYKYGVDNPSKCKEISNKISQVKKNNNLDENYKKSIISKQKNTTFERYGDENFRNIDKAKETYLLKYGTDNNMKSKDGIESHKASIISKYGVDNVFKLESILEKSRNTKKLKYGEEYYSKTEEWKEKTYKTKKKHNTFNTSSEEDEIYKLLCTKFSVTRQYTSELYPFDCDFYLSDRDIYIEYQGSWTHGGHPYSDDENDRVIVDKWKSKGTKFYDNAINTWTIRDVTKRNKAKENKITLLEFFNMKDFLDWFNSFV